LFPFICVWEFGPLEDLLLLGWLRDHTRGSWWERSIPNIRFGFSRGINPVGKIYVRLILSTACFAFCR
jgi:hypothetical protein